MLENGHLKKRINEMCAVNDFSYPVNSVNAVLDT
jgi:hypothetical protein